MAQTNEEVRDTELHQEEIRPDATATDPVVTSPAPRPATPQEEGPAITWGSDVAFFGALLFFSGLFADAAGWWKVFDFSVLNGSFGTWETAAGKMASFRGSGGTGARDGFVFALTLLPALIFAIALIHVVEGYGGLKVAEKMLSPLLRPLLGIPGVCGLAMIANLQTTDAAAGMTKVLYEDSLITSRERSIFCGYQISGSAPLSNYFSSGVAVFSILLVPIGLPILVIMIFKFIGGNIVRFYLRATEGRDPQAQVAEGKAGDVA